MARRRGRTNVDWGTPENGWTWDHVTIEVLMDIRAELKTLNLLLGCPNFTGIPTTLRTIARKVTPRRETAK